MPPETLVRGVRSVARRARGQRRLRRTLYCSPVLEGLSQQSRHTTTTRLLVNDERREPSGWSVEFDVPAQVTRGETDEMSTLVSDPTPHAVISEQVLEPCPDRVICARVAELVEQRQKRGSILSSDRSDVHRPRVDAGVRCRP